MTANYPGKCWYVAATCDEVTQTPKERRLLGTDVALWRTADGRPMAFANRCAHRGFPLSHSRVDGNTLICGYHGCTYDEHGQCVQIAAQQQVPEGMHVPTYPVIEAGPFVWIWLGFASAAVGTRPPSLPWVTDPQWTTFADAWQIEANYLMVHEHLLDFSYAPVVHAGDLPDGLDTMPSFNDVEVTETTVSYRRSMPDLPLAGWQADGTGLDPNSTYLHSESGTFVSPAVQQQHWNIETLDGRVYTTTRTHAITPETDTSTHIFLQSSRNYALGDQTVTAGLRAFLARVSRRDTKVLEMANAHAGYDGWRDTVEFQADAAAIRVRRIVGVMLAKESGLAPIRPGLAPNSRGSSLSPSGSRVVGP